MERIDQWEKTMANRLSHKWKFRAQVAEAALEELLIDLSVILNSDDLDPEEVCEKDLPRIHDKLAKVVNYATA